MPSGSALQNCKGGSSMKPLKRIVSALLAAVCTAGLLCSHTAAAERAPLSGDVNADGAVTAADAALLADYLTAEKSLAAPASADLNADGILNAADLTLLKRQILTPHRADALMQRPLDALSPSMPATGTVRVLTVLVSFPDCAHPASVTPEQVAANCFGPAAPESAAYPMESISAYYARASHGRLTLEGDVYAYTAQNESKSYIGLSGKFFTEIFKALDETVDFTRYDSDGDGCVDAVIAAVPDALGQTDWLPSTGTYSEKLTFDGMRIDTRSFGAADITKAAAFNSTWTHELGHAMGLPDYYKYVNTESGVFGLNGDAGWELMDDAAGDLSAFSKLLLGWYRPSEVQIYTGGTQTFELPCAQTAPGCVVIPRTAPAASGEPMDWLSEYFVLDYQSAAGNNAASLRTNTQRTLFRSGGLRILHGEATVCQGILHPELKWSNFGRYYDKHNEKQRVLRLVNEAEGGGFFTAGDTVTGSISGFRWYDADGSQTVSAGVKIHVDSITDDRCTVTISPAAS